MPNDTLPATEPVAVILVAEDDDLIRTLISRLITSLQATPLVVADGAAALTAVQTHGSSLTGAVLDVVMPHRSGIHVAAAIQQQGFTIPIVLMSGAIPAHLAPDLATLRGIILLPKPFDLTELATLLHVMIPARTPPTVGPTALR
ncbi:MAG TPA: response regulator [Herpetosiphonaceae bacterium]